MLPRASSGWNTPRDTPRLWSRAELDPEVHDLGFLFFSTYYRWHRLTLEPALRDVLIEAGRTLAQRFQEKGQYLRSFVGPNSLFIDIMMNVGIIFYAARETGDRRLRDIAMRHSLTTRRVLVRGDGSTAHEGHFRHRYGRVLYNRPRTRVIAGDSCWSRGLAWALYGFTTAYEYSRDPRFPGNGAITARISTSRHSPTDGIPPWDFNAPVENRTLLDTSAAAICAAGLLRLCRLVPDSLKGHLYWSTAVRILRSLCEKHLANPSRSGKGFCAAACITSTRDWEWTRASPGANTSSARRWSGCFGLSPAVA